jgi:hypothetical protein
MNFNDFQEAMVIVFGNIGQWMLALFAAGSILTSVFIAWLLWLRNISQLG